MSKTLVERLRTEARWLDPYGLLKDSADALERLEADAQRKDEALRQAHPYFTAILKNRMPFTTTDILDACVIEKQIADALSVGQQAPEA